MYISTLALVTHRYENHIPSHGPGELLVEVKQMCTIEIRTRRGKSLLVLQSGDSELEIKATLKNSDWTIVSWIKDTMEIIPTTTLEKLSDQRALSSKLVSGPKSFSLLQNKSVSIWLICLSLILISVVLANLFS